MLKQDKNSETERETDRFQYQSKSTILHTIRLIVSLKMTGHNWNLYPLIYKELLKHDSMERARFNKTNHRIERVHFKSYCIQHRMRCAEESINLFVCYTYQNGEGDVENATHGCTRVHYR
jgi:hypothetical protein